MYIRVSFLHSQIFTGNSDSNSIVQNLFPYPVLAKYLRIRPRKNNNPDEICMRLEILGCRQPGKRKEGQDKNQCPDQDQD